MDLIGVLEHSQESTKAGILLSNNHTDVMQIVQTCEGCQMTANASLGQENGPRRKQRQ